MKIETNIEMWNILCTVKKVHESIIYFKFYFKIYNELKLSSENWVFL